MNRQKLPDPASKEADIDAPYKPFLLNNLRENKFAISFDFSVFQNV